MSLPSHRRTSWTGVRLAAVLVLSAGLVLSGSAAARGGDDKAAAKVHFEAGAAHYRSGRFDEAIREYRFAYEAFPKPDILFNLGQAYRQKGDDAKAVALYRRFLAEASRHPARIEAEEHIATLERRIAEAHAAELRRQAEARAAAEVNAAALRRQPEAAPIPATPTALSPPRGMVIAPDDAVATNDAAGAGEGLGPWFRVAFNLGLGALMLAGAGTGEYLWVRSEVERLNATCPAPCTIPEVEIARRRYEIGVGLWTAAGIAAAVDLVVWIRWATGRHRDGGRGMALAPWLRPDGGGLSARLEY